MTQVVQNDRVKINCPGNIYHGKTGVVSDVLPEDRWPVGVYFEERGIRRFGFFKFNEVEKVNHG